MYGVLSYDISSRGRMYGVLSYDISSRGRMYGVLSYDISSRGRMYGVLSSGFAKLRNIEPPVFRILQVVTSTCKRKSKADLCLSSLLFFVFFFWQHQLTIMAGRLMIL
mgnify:CR=1 FL=1